MGDSFDQIGLGVAIGALKKEFSDLGFSVVGNRLADALEQAGRRTAKLENDRDAALAERDKWKQNYTRLLNAKLDGSWRLKFDEEITRLENERGAAFALGVEVVAKLAVEKSAAIRVESDDEDLEDWAANQMRASAGTLEFFAYTLRQDAPTTPLQAALALPEVRELVEAGRLAEQQLIALGSDGFGSGLTAAPAKLEAKE